MKSFYQMDIGMVSNISRELHINCVRTSDSIIMNFTDDNTLILEIGSVYSIIKNDQLLENINFVIKENHISNIAIDMKNVKWIDSSSIGALINIKKLTNGDCCLFNVSPTMFEVFTILRLDKILTISATTPERFSFLCSCNNKHTN